MKRIRFIRQRDSMLCGVASLCMICRYFGLNCDTKWLEQFCVPTAEGVSFKSIADGAAAVGIDSKCLHANIDFLKSCPLPAILLWNQNHFVVLYKISHKGNRFHIADPAKGCTYFSTSDFSEHWCSNIQEGKKTGIVMVFNPSEKFGEIKSTHSKNLHSWKFLFSYVKRYRNYFTQITLGIMLVCIFQLVMPFLTQAIVDSGIQKKNIGIIWLILFGELMIVAGRTATDFIRRWLLLHISMRINISLLSDFFIKLLKLPMNFFDTKLLGDLLQRIADHDRIQYFLTTQVLGVTFSLVSFIVFGVILLIFDKLVFGIFILSTAIYVFWIISFLNRRKILDYEVFACHSRSQNTTYRFVSTMQEIKLQDCEQRRRWEWEDAQADLFKIEIKQLSLQQAQESGSIFINEIKNILITVIAATGVIKGNLTLGTMLAIQYIVGQLNSPVDQLMRFIYSIQDTKISLERINEIHGSDDESDPMGSTSFRGNKSIKIRNLTFKYDPHALTPTLSDVDILIPSGKVTAIVGASGSGKSTLIRLLLGYYRTGRNMIEIAEKPLEEYNMKWWRKQCGVVMQDGVIFSESIERNIASDDKTVDYDRLYYAAHMACADRFIESLPLKYNTKIGPDGLGLSQGQKQRILIARAIYRNPEFLFMDEATNSLDANNERSIVNNLQEFFKGRTVVIVAHRLSTVRNADNIIVLDNGRVKETGCHDTLIERHGMYYNLIKNQLEIDQ